MKRILSLLLVTVLLFACASPIRRVQAENGQTQQSASDTAGTETEQPRSAEERAATIFDQLTFLYEGELFLLKEKLLVWSLYLSNITDSSRDPSACDYWFYSQYLLSDFSRFFMYYNMMDRYGLNINGTDVYGTVSTMYNVLYRMSGDKLTTYFYMIYAMCAYKGDEDRLAKMQKEIADLAKDHPNYAHLDLLRDLYDATVKITAYVDYTSDNYPNTSSRLSDFQVEKEVLKNKFQGAFTWMNNNNHLGVVYIQSLQDAITAKYGVPATAGVDSPKEEEEPAQ